MREITRSAKRAILKSPVREYRSPGSVRGHPGDRVSYLDNAMPTSERLSLVNGGDTRSLFHLRCARAKLK
jgi:hypothetical protein